MQDTQPRVLVVDPDKEGVRALAQVLHGQGFAIGALGDAGQVGPALVRFAPNVVVVASELGQGRTGLGVIEQLRADARAAHLPLVLSIAEPDGPSVLAALRAGAADILSRPLEAERDATALSRLAHLRRDPGQMLELPAAERLARVAARFALSLKVQLPGRADAYAIFESGELVEARLGPARALEALSKLLSSPAVEFAPAESTPFGRGEATAEFSEGEFGGEAFDIDLSTSGPVEVPPAMLPEDDAADRLAALPEGDEPLFGGPVPAAVVPAQRQPSPASFAAAMPRVELPAPTAPRAAPRIVQGAAISASGSGAADPGFDEDPLGEVGPALQARRPAPSAVTPGGARRVDVSRPPSGEIPFVQRPGTPVPYQLVQVDVSPAPPPAITLGRCLLVDDEPDLLRLFSVFLTRVGFQVTTAHDGLAGYEAALLLRPAIMVVDINMPRLDGWGLLRRLRSDVRVAETPVVFLSAQDDYRESLRAVGAGAQDYLSKSSRMELLARRIRDVLLPREAAMARLKKGEGIHGRLEQLGVRWTLFRLAEARGTGTLACADGLGVYNVGLHEGHVVFVAGARGEQRAAGAEALAWMHHLRTGDLQWLPGLPPSVENFEGSLARTLDAIATELNAREQAQAEQLLSQQGQVKVDGQLFQLYERFCSPLARQVAQLIRQGQSPREILGQVQASPTEVEDVVRDLLRRDVIRVE